MADEPRITELLSFADDLALTDAERYRLALILGNLLAQSWEEGYRFGWKWGWSAGSDDILFRTSQHTTYNSH